MWVLKWHEYMRRVERERAHLFVSALRIPFVIESTVRMGRGGGGMSASSLRLGRGDAREEHTGLRATVPYSQAAARWSEQTHGL